MFDVLRVFYMRHVDDMCREHFIFSPQRDHKPYNKIHKLLYFVKMTTMPIAGEHPCITNLF